MSDSTTSKMITLKSNDGVDFLVPETVVKQSQTICHIIEDISPINIIPLFNVSAPILAMVIEYCKKHIDEAAVSKIEMTKDGSSTTTTSSRISDEELRNWDKQFVDVDLRTLFDLIMAANYLHIQGLLDVTTQKVADMINPEELRQTFNIKDYFTSEEEKVIRREFKWAFE